MTTKKKRRESLRDRLRIIARDGMLGGLNGLPVGGWAETAQALREFRDNLPSLSERTYTVDELIDALYVVDYADRYARKDE